MSVQSEKPKGPIPCDQCKRRKVRCNYNDPCERCQTSKLNCSYTTIRKKRGPKRSRGAVVDQLRLETGAQPSSADVSTHEQASLPSHTPVALGSLLTPDHRLESDWQEPSAIQESYFSFDDFAQSILSSSNWQPPVLPDVSPLPFAIGELSNSSAQQTPSGVGEHVSPLSQLATISLPADSGSSTTFEATDLVFRGVELFFSHMYPTYPIVDQRNIYDLLENENAVTERQACLIWSMCALTMTHVDKWPGLTSEQRMSAARHFIRKCLSVRVKLEIAEEASFYDVLCSLFIGIAFFELKCRKTSWFYVREAIVLAFATGLQRPDLDLTMGDDERQRRRRAYAILFVTERAACVFDGFPVSIFHTPELLPISCVNEDVSIAPGMQALHELFGTLDFNFVSLWNNPSSFTSVDKGFPELSILQDHLRQPIDLQRVSDIQRADVLITQQWLRLVFWQAALRRGLVSSASTHTAFQYDFPLEIASTLCDIIRSLAPIAIQVHGLGIFEKQFEIAYSLLDTLTLSGTAQAVDHHENLRYLLLSLSASPSSRQIYVRTLEKRISTEAGPGAGKYRSLAGVQLLRDDSNSRQTSRRQSVVPSTNIRF